MNKILLPISFLLLLNVCQTTEDRKRGCELCLFEKNESFMKLQKCAIIDKDSCAGKPPGSQEMKDCYRECENKYSKNAWRRDSAKAKEICFEKEKCTEEYMPERPFYE